jgi:predicted nuclease of predicted toxin-antitoxin system
MRIVVNENVSASVIRELRSRGHDVLAAKEGMPGTNDESILARAQAENRLVVTHDKDFGELAFRFGLPANCGVLLIRLSGQSAQADIELVLNVIDSRDDWAGHFSVADRGRVRMRPLPSSQKQQKPK